MSGLGIDMGPSERSPRRPSGPRAHSRSRSHTTLSETRRVRIASGQPRILGDEDSPELTKGKPAAHPATARSFSLAGPTPPLSVSDGGSSGLGIFDAYAPEVKPGYIADGFGGWVKEEDVDNGVAPNPCTPSDSPLLIPPPPKSKLRVMNPSPAKSILTPPPSEPSTSPEVRTGSLPNTKGSHSPASLALSDITVSSKSSGGSSSASQKRSTRKLISARRPSSAAGVDDSSRSRSRSRSMSLFLGRPKSASGLEIDKADQAKADGRSSPSKSSSKGKLSKSRSHASLVSWSATGWAGTGLSRPGLRLDSDDEADKKRRDAAASTPSSVSAYSDDGEAEEDKGYSNIAIPTIKQPFSGPAQHLYDSPVRQCAPEDTPKVDRSIQLKSALLNSSQNGTSSRTLRSNTQSTSRLNALAAEFNPRPPTAVAMAPAGNGDNMRQASAQSIRPSDSQDTIASANSMPPMRSMRFWAGLEGASKGEAMVCLDPVTGQFVQGEAIVPGRIVSNRGAGLAVGEGSILAAPTSGTDSFGSNAKDRKPREHRAGHADTGASRADSMSRRDSHMSWGGESTSSLGPHDSASNVGRGPQAQHLQQSGRGLMPNKTIHRQQSVPILPSAMHQTSSDHRALHHQQSHMNLSRNQDERMAGGEAMNRWSNHTVTGASMYADDRRRRQSTMLTTSTNFSNGSSSSSGLDRSGTLLSASAHPARRSRELNRLLGNSARKLDSSAGRPSSHGDDASRKEHLGDDEPEQQISASGLGIEGLPETLGNTLMSRSSTAIGASSAAASSVGSSAAVTAGVAALEQAKHGKARVEVDLVLETDLVVEGCSLKGRLQIKVRKPQEGEGTVMLAQPKIRIVGFEELIGDETRHIFYHHAMVIDGDRSNGGPSEPYVLHGSPNLFSPEAEGRLPLPCFIGPQDGEGYCRGREGAHSIPFSLEVPIGKGAKGSYRGKTSVVRYIVIGSVKLKSSNGSDRSIAHFYRHIDLFPYLNPSVVLAAAPKPIVSQGQKGLFMGGSGKVQLTASLHRSTWVAGQRVYVNIAVNNETSKKVKNLHLALVRTVTLFKPKPEFNVGFSVPADPAESYIDPDACTTSTNRKKICEDSLELGQKGAKGSVTARGWWTGVDPGCSLDVSHYMTIPADCLTILRGRHVEVMYSIKVAVSGTFSSDVSVELPLRVINFVSLDPPPAKQSSKSSFGTSSMAVSRTWSHAAQAEGSSVPQGLSPVANRMNEAPMIARVRSMDALRSPTKVEIKPRHQLHLPLPSSRALNNLSGSDSDEAATPRNTTRRLQHQKSLDFINHAIRSATARRGLTSSNANSPLGLGIEVPDDNELRSMEYRESSSAGVMPTDQVRRLSMASTHSHASNLSAATMDPNCLPYVHPRATMPHLVPPITSVNPQLLLNSVSLDEAGDDFEEMAYKSQRSGHGGSVAGTPLSMNDDSVDELDMVIHSTRIEGLPVFGVPAVADDDEDGNTTFDSVSTARCIREEPEFEEKAQDSSSPPSQHVTAPLNLTKKASAPQLQDEQTPKSFQSECFGGTHSDASGSPASEIGTVEVSIHHSPESEGGHTPTVFHDAPTSATPDPEPSARKSSGSSRSKGKGKAVTDTGSFGRSGKSQASAKEAVPFPRTDSPVSDGSGRRVRSVAEQSSNGDRGSSGSRGAASPKKGSLKTKGSFTFATLDKPLKMQKDRPTAPPTASKTSIAPRNGTGGPVKGGDHSAKDSQAPSKRGAKQGTGRHHIVAKVSAPLQSSAAPVKAKVKESPAPSPAPASKSPAAEPKTAAPEPTNPRPSNHLRHTASLADLGQGAEETPSSVSVTTERNLQRSSSTHNLRGSAVVIPSVRNKIAMLESRSQLLRDFATPGSHSNSSSPAVDTSVTSVGEVPMRRGARSSNAAQSRKDSTSEGDLLLRKSSVNSLSAQDTPIKASRTSGGMAGLPNSMSMGRLARKPSTLSIAESEDSTMSKPEYLKRTESLMSFKAPVLKSVKALVQERERAAAAKEASQEQ
ncbi:hypothetical protein OC846_001516 [Tilletia horrida]|uniref:Arrestin C-terminal-like domain-containing protein n=1 Tax=Tilletia horrida TaxID=155126 RepID=A0AAN6GSL5_9BASI|nr:hypothetical protein OC845_001476 [Tilletia horrida]KAK0555964.1 hypothetical protein OC846_001516 [Tilletia horrida]KAK0568852.1 hypothetical protein OC861_001545 [Tilletia horrida]